MLRSLMERRKDDEGFTLIELMVVVLIIGILVAIALPTFLGARTRAQDRAAQSDLRNGAATADSYFTDGDTYSGFDAAQGEADEPSLEWVDETDLGAIAEGQVGVAYADVNEVVLIAVSASGKGYCFAKVVTTGGTTAAGQYKSVETTAGTNVGDAADCEGIGGSW